MAQLVRPVTGDRTGGQARPKLAPTRSHVRFAQLALSGAPESELRAGRWLAVQRTAAADTWTPIW